MTPPILYCALIVDDAAKKDRRRTCGHRHINRDDAVKCALNYTAKHPHAQSYVGEVGDAGPFLRKR